MKIIAILLSLLGFTGIGYGIMSYNHYQEADALAQKALIQMRVLKEKAVTDPVAKQGFEAASRRFELDLEALTEWKRKFRFALVGGVTLDFLGVALLIKSRKK